MANEMMTFVKVVSKKPEVAVRLQEIFKSRKGNHEIDALDVINNIKGTSYCYKNEKEDFDVDVDFPSNQLWEEMIGPKWMFLEYDHAELPEDCNIVLTSAWAVPIPFLLQLRAELQKVDEDCYIKGTYEDESYDPSGAFIAGKFDYDDIEDNDEIYDWDEANEDDYYSEQWSMTLHDMMDNLETAYLDYVTEMEENPK
jgi:hypothetical protein